MIYQRLGRKKSKVISYFSHDYITANHGDIVSFIALLIVIGLMFDITAPFAKLFIMLQHNVTVNGSRPVSVDTAVSRTATLYTAGRFDILTCLFYCLIAIVIHSVVQKFAVDKLTRKLHLSKTTHSRVSESAQLVLFYLISLVWGVNIVYRERLAVSPSSLWAGYPHLHLTFWFKFYFICQICYWLHCFPELYFQRVKPSEVPGRVATYAASLACVSLAYLLNLSRIAVLLLVLHYASELVFHCSRLLRAAGRTRAAWYGFALWDGLFVCVRVLSVALASVTFALGLEKTSRDRISIREGNFNTKFIRLNCLVLTCLVQGYLMWRFITFHVRRAKQFLDQSSAVQASSPKRLRRAVERKTLSSSPKRPVVDAGDATDDVDDADELPEADRHYPDLRRRKLA